MTRDIWKKLYRPTTTLLKLKRGANHNAIVFQNNPICNSKFNCINTKQEVKVFLIMHENGINSYYAFSDQKIFFRVIIILLGFMLVINALMTLLNACILKCSYPQTSDKQLTDLRSNIFLMQMNLSFVLNFFLYGFDLILKKIELQKNKTKGTAINDL